MRINKTSDKFIKINQIKDLKSIEVYDVRTSAKDKMLISPGFIIFYGPMKSMVLTTDDEYFEDYVKKLREVYLEEKDRIIESGIMGDKKIEINPLTKSLLLNGNIENTSELYSFYKNKKGYSESLFFEEDKLKAFFEIISYHIKNTMKLFDIEISDMSLSGGMNGVYYIRCKKNNVPVILPLYFVKREDNNYQITVGNLFDKAIPLVMDILFTKDGINVNNIVTSYEFSDFNSYKYDDKGTIERIVELKNELIHYSKNDLPIATSVPLNVANLDNNDVITTWYKYPWNAYEGVTKETYSINKDGTLEEKDGEEQLINKRMIYLTDNEDDIFLKESYSKRYRKRTTSIEESRDILFDNLEKQIIGLKKKEGFLFETSFYGNAVTGFYKTNLLGKNFYHISSAKTKEELTSESMYSLDKEDSVEEKADLVDTDKIFKKVRGVK